MSSSSLEVSAPLAGEIPPVHSPLIDPHSPGPIRAELLGLEGLENEARGLAGACALAPVRRAGSPLLRRFVSNQKVLLHARQAILAGGRQRIHGIDADWLADNFHIVEEVLKEIRLDLPRGYDAVLPKLRSAPLAGYPRVYALALALVAHTDTELDEVRITRFVRAFQEVEPLTIGELWALPTMLRLVVIENLRRLAEQMLRGYDARQAAERWFAEAMRSRAGAAGATAPPPLPSDLSDPFVVRMLRLLQDQGPSAAPLLERLEAALEARGRDPEQILRGEHHRQATNQVTVGNCVLSLRLLAAVDWNAFFERSSVVQRVLLEDPSGAYALQDFRTSDRYRKTVERIARGARAGESDVAARAVELAREGMAEGPARGHVGYYLAGPGEGVLRAAFGYRPTPRERILGWVLGHPEVVYFGSIALLVGLAMLALLRLIAATSGEVPLAWSALIAAVAFLPVSELAVGLVNHLLTLLLPPRVLPRLQLKGGVPDDFATFVVMPSMLVRPGSAETLCQRLEAHYLANPGPGLRFALLTDFADAPSEEMPGDSALIEDALERIRALNRRYAAEGQDLFYLFHRRRLWNPGQGCWMGHERKRGKLSEFNRLLRGDRGTTYSAFSHDPGSLSRIRFVVTLDADTQMPRDTVARMIGTLAHPLNQPRFDASAGRVVEGYGVLQPRVSFHLTAATHSYFAALLASSGGIDPYSTAASDTYMDLFGLGSFTGKGIYDVDAFEAATGHTFPDNHILSHDLIEGNYARCGLLSDTELFDDFPARYNAHSRREHRWVRGDWQLLPWLGPRVPAPEGRRANPLPLLERWKLLDNLRRSLVPPALVLMLVLGWTALPGAPWVWSLVAAIVLSLPLIKWVIGASLGCLRTGTLTALKSWRENLLIMGGQTALSVVSLADQSRLMCDAIGRTLARLYVTRRRLLEWETAAATEQRLGAGLRDFAAGMWVAPALAVAAGAVVALLRPGALWAAVPILAAWLASPPVAYLISRPKPRRDVALGEEEQRELRRVARKTWHFFESFVSDEDHWLPPDNFQEIPSARVAHRTSPTNQGLLLVSTLAAHDLGYLTLGGLVERLEKTFDTLERLERHWGHFYNWYDTRTLQVLQPAYLSTVDSGNFLGCLLVLKQGLREKAREPLLGPHAARGLADTFRQIEAPDGPARVRVEELLRSAPSRLVEWDEWLGRLEDGAAALVATIPDDADSEAESPRHPGREGSPSRWARKFLAEIQGRRAELSHLAPWLPRVREWERADNAETAEWWRRAADVLDAPASVEALASRAPAVLAELHEIGPPAGDAGGPVGAAAADDLRARLLGLADRAEAMARSMDFRPLYKEDRHLYTIGVDLNQGQLDGPCYDLLASESALTSYLTVARGDAPRRHWFQLGRPFIRAAGRLGLLSWGGTMFEYLMPRLLLRALPGTLLDQACRTAVARQIEFGRDLGIPWGVSESAFNSQFVGGDYRYQAFGVPGLGLKRGLEKDRVVAPYATAMAAMIAPREAIANLRRLSAEGAEGGYGYYEAIDYTAERLAPGQRSAVIRSYMAHHQGMSLVALANALLDEPMPRRFHAEPMVRAAELLLQERVPPDPPIVETVTAEAARGGEGPAPGTAVTPLSRRLTTPETAAPRTHLLSNHGYHVMITNAGSGYSRCQDLDLTRWREDPTCEPWGQFFYIRDLANGRFWSAGHQPACRAADAYEVVFSADKALFRRRDGEIETTLEVTVSPEEPAEVRRITLSNQGTAPRQIEVTSYLEPVLAPHASDLAHPAFAKLFLETDHVAASDALLARRRPRAADEATPWGVHVMAVDSKASGSSPAGDLEFETDRGRFLGRGRSLAAPAALDPGAGLSGTTGAVLDPALVLRRRFRIEPGGSAVIGFTLARSDSREAALALADKYHSISAVARAFEMAWAHSQVEQAHRDWSPEDAHLYQRLGSHLLFAGSLLRAGSTAMLGLGPATPALARCGISGDRPIAVAKVEDPSDLALVRQLLTAQDFLRLKGLEVDLVLLNGEESPQFREQLHFVIREARCEEKLHRPGGIFLLERGSFSEEDARALECAAHAVLDGVRGQLSGQLDRVERLRTPPASLVAETAQIYRKTEPAARPPDLQFFNGLGGFTADGREYCVLIESRDAHDRGTNGRPHPGTGVQPVLPPAPWVNVVANPRFGFLVSESGSGFTWAGNSQTNRLTPWSNDPVADPPGEAIYVRDEQTGEVWCPTPLPIASGAQTVVRHGHGYSVFARNTHGIEHELMLMVPAEASVKVLRLRMRNAGHDHRRLSATFFAEWVLGTTRERSAMHVATEVDPETGALLARNPFRQDFPGSVAFADVSRRPRTLTADRAEFLGRHGSMAAPAALSRVGLSGRTGAAIDPCAAIQTTLDLAPGEEAEVIFLLGEADDLRAARSLIHAYRDGGTVEEASREVARSWDRMLGAVQVQTPDRALDLLLNRWLLYQVVSCRLWARTGVYQSAGAFGFRDQLQDVMAMVHAAPELTRSHLLLAASRQFLEGDVQHWWLPPSGRGVRTRISDDLLWLVAATTHYVEATGDTSVLDARVPYLTAPALEDGREDDFRLPRESPEDGSLYDHCVRALERSLSFGPHGLPLIGAGDWNDGMNRLGLRGKGESVWLGWFLIDCLRRFSTLAEARRDPDRAGRYRDVAEQVHAAIERHAWDGSWYLRAFDDDGTPLGTAGAAECRIDSIAQSWAVLSGQRGERGRQAMESVERLLFRREAGILLLLTPPFDGTHGDPGYIKGYPPGVRENGAQYTHAATWAVKAVAELGEGRLALDMLGALNPINHTRDPEHVGRYRAEPYVLAGDVLGRPAGEGRAGWTWYTGAAAWLHRVALESILGIRRAGGRLSIDPCIPPGWGGFRVTYRAGPAEYRIRVENPHGVSRGVASVSLDGRPQEDPEVPMDDDGRSHDVIVLMGTS
ncbi:MAG: glucoamylase family protein [Isosphaeraceae bacterium]